MAKGWGNMNREGIEKPEASSRQNNRVEDER